MAGLINQFTNNIKKAKARVLVIGTIFLMILVVMFGTVSVLRFSYAPVVKQYQEKIGLTLNRVAENFESIDGKTAFLNIDQRVFIDGDMPLLKLPIDYINYLPGHVDDIKTIASCSYSYKDQPYSHICAGVLDNRNNGAMAYIQGSFDLDGEIYSATYAKSPKPGHHFLLSIESRGIKDYFIITFENIVHKNDQNNRVFPMAWSMTGFRFLKKNKMAYVREPDIKGRLLSSNNKKNHYEYIFQVPIHAYAEDAVLVDKKWPPSDLEKTKVSLKLVKPESGSSNTTILDTTNLANVPMFSFSGMAIHLEKGETLTFISPRDDLPSKEVKINSLKPEEKHIYNNTLDMIVENVSNILIQAVLPSISTEKSYKLADGSVIKLNGNASLIFTGWKSAAQAIIIFALLLCTMLVLAGMVFYYYLLLPLNKLRKNTLYLSDKFSDSTLFKLPYTINSKNDEIGVLWETILDMHRSITSYGRESLESTKRQADFLRVLGHEIKSPLQDLIIRHSEALDPDFKIIKRITHALTVLSNNPISMIGHDLSAITPKEAISAYKAKLTQENVTEYINNAEETYENINYSNRDKILKVMADADLLEAALTAILNNACDFRTPGTIINITSYSDAEDVLISISNIGPHIKQYPIEDIFEFGVSSRLENNDNQGIGLYVAKNNIINMGGDLMVKNTDNGVRFDIKLIKAK
ncbi:TPA: sensor histidine kinase [Morganella morganii]